ncbi:hypothetical protein N0V93_002268 [Gnomoniopsis smithogilvyi]|uniref:NmrA-like domain-containing protein n=1 Tax=Gnomoniopsis smithogilvyi TaxID=1191159 RepID=A0A9W8YWE2_9PEZI|nr:hypothetical protein N0V93_002268 [Gnomoniopsis smithogilvyi]
MSSRKYDNVIVFGPTGTVGGITALEASKRGAKVWLAMHLTDPASVTKVAQESGAKAAYIYLIHSADMRSSLQALRDGGIEYVVFLSSYTVTGNLRQHTKENWIPWVHAQVEIALEEIGFPHVTALRPAYFASNFYKNYLDRSVKPPKISYIYADAVADLIAPEDIGAVGGAVLVERPQDGKEVIVQCGPQLLTLEQGLELIKKITGRKDLETKPMPKDEYIQDLVDRGLPPPLVHYLADAAEKQRRAQDLYPKSIYEPAVAVTKKYAGKDPMRFEEYIERHKAEWQAV